MVFNPSSEDRISESLETRLRGRITKLTNFVETGFNKLFLSAFAEELYEYEIRLLAAQLSGWVDYAGGPIDQQDLDQLGISEFDDLDRLNEYMDDQQLDNIASLVGVSRSPGDRATGVVRIDTFDSNTQVPNNLSLSTDPDATGGVFRFSVDLGDEDYVTPADQNNQDYVEVDVVADQPGEEYNGATISRFRGPPPGLQSVSVVTTPDGGVGEEENDELRERVKDAVFETSGGGTVAGIRGFIINNVDNVSDVFVDEYTSQCPPFVDVIVDGGAKNDAVDAIEEARPAGIQHNFVRPVTHNLGVQIEVLGTDIDAQTIKNDIEDYVLSLELGEDYIEDRIIQRVLNVEPDVENVLALNTRLISVDNERIEYDGSDKYDILSGSPLSNQIQEDHYFDSDTDVYELNTLPANGATIEIIAYVNGESTDITGAGWTFKDTDQDQIKDSIDFTNSSPVPDDGSVFTVRYSAQTSATETITYDGSDVYDLTYTPALAEDSSVTDNSGDTYKVGTHYDIVDTDGDGEKDAIDWSIGGPTPSNSEDFTVSYELDMGSISDVDGILNGSQNNFEEGVDFNELDSNADGFADQIDWSVGGDAPDNGTVFSVDYSAQLSTRNDYFVDDRSKISVVPEEIEVVTYE